MLIRATLLTYYLIDLLDVAIQDLFPNVRLFIQI